MAQNHLHLGHCALLLHFALVCRILFTMIALVMLFTAGRPLVMPAVLFRALWVAVAFT